MEPAQVIHIVITVVALIGAGAVALVCDMLKTNNERLRQSNMELRIRREEEQRRTEMALEQLRQLSESMAARALPAVEQAPLPALPPPPPPRRTRGLAAGRSSAAASADPPYAGATIEEARALARNLLTVNFSGGPGVFASRGERSVFAAASTQSNGLAEAARPRKNWAMLLKTATVRRAVETIDVTPAPTARQRGELIPFESLQSNHDNPHLPPGFHPSGALTHLLDSRAPFRGMIVAIGVNGLPGEPRPAMLTGAVSDYLRSLLEPSEFVCQPAADRYVLVSQERDGAAQRRLDVLGRKLSSFELNRSAAAALFLCAGFESNGEPLCEAVRTAVCRLDGIREAHHAPTAEPALRKVV